MQSTLVSGKSMCPHLNQPVSKSAQAWTLSQYYIIFISLFLKKTNLRVCMHHVAAIMLIMKTIM